MGMFFSAKCDGCWERVDHCTCGKYTEGRRFGSYNPPPVVHVHNYITIVEKVNNKNQRFTVEEDE